MGEHGKCKIEIKVESNSEDGEGQVVRERVSEGPRLEGLDEFELHFVPKNVPTTIRMWPMMYSAILKELTPPVELREQGPPQNDPLLWSMSRPVPQIRHCFSLTQEERLSILTSLKGFNKYTTQVLLRFCKVPDPVSNDTEVEDWYPERLAVFVNGIEVQIPTKSGNKKCFKPLEITQFVKLSEPTNVVDVYWKRNHDLRVYAMNIYLCKELTVKDLIKKACDNKWSPPEKSLQWIKNIVWKRGDDSVISEEVNVSTNCPISRKPFKLPCRGVNCAHPTCFDMLSLFKVNSRRKHDKTFCPCCNNPLKMEDLRIDELFAKVLQITEGSGVESFVIHEQDSVDDVLERVQSQVRRQ